MSNSENISFLLDWPQLKEFQCWTVYPRESTEEVHRLFRFHFLLHTKNSYFLGFSIPYRYMWNTETQKIRILCVHQEIYQLNVCKRQLSFIRYVCVLFTCYWIKFFPDSSCFITGNMIRHNSRYLVLNIVAHKFVLLSFYSIR